MDAPPGVARAEFHARFAAIAPDLFGKPASAAGGRAIVAPPAAARAATQDPYKASVPTPPAAGEEIY